MSFTSPSRRALGLLAASTIAMSTAVLGVTGVASAVAPSGAPAPFSFSSDDEGSATVPPGYCAIAVSVIGAQGGDGADTFGWHGGALETVIPVTAHEVLDLYPGTSGGDFDGTAAGGINADPDDDGSLDGEDGDTYYDVDADTDYYSGGGGAASTIVVDGAIIALAFGGDGGDAEAVGQGYGGGGGSNYADTDVAYDVSADSGGGSGYIEGSGVLCDAPLAPVDLTVEGGANALDIAFDRELAEDESGDADAWEVSLDGGDTWKPLTVKANYPRDFTATVANIPAGTYQVQVRGTNEAGNGIATASVSTTVYNPIGAPTITSVTTGVSQITVTWSAPTSAGTYALAGYQVGYSFGEGGSDGCTTTVDVRTCTFFLPAGPHYQPVVFAVDAENHNGVPAVGDPVAVSGPAVPSSVPTKVDGTITGPAGPITSLTAGQKLTLQGTGFAANSTVQLTIFSTATSLGTATTDGNGAFSVEVTLPAGLANGSHTLVASGVAPDGSARNLVTAVTVSGGTAAVTTAVTPAALATTGFDTAVPLVGGALALLAGGGLLVGARRRRTS